MQYKLNESDIPLPDTVADIARVIGTKAALALVENYGGSSIYAPLGVNKTGRAALERLVPIIGEDAAKALSRYTHGERIYIPRCDAAMRRLRNLKMCECFEEAVRAGSSGNAIVQTLARDYQLSDRQVWKILKQTAPAESPQASLF